MAVNVEEARAKLLKGAPEQVTFVAIERCEHKASYWCYYTVARNLEKPRCYHWRRAEVDYESLFGTGDPSFFWDAQPIAFTPLTERDSARLWVERHLGRWEALEELLQHFELWKDFLAHTAEYFGWDKNAGVLTLLPKEIEDRPRLAQKLLEDRLVRRKDA